MYGVRNDILLWFMQILGLLPPFKGKDVIELGAGIGRFTGELAKTAGHVVAMDFMENLIKKVMLTETWQKYFVIAFYYANCFFGCICSPSKLALWIAE